VRERDWARHQSPGSGVAFRPRQDEHASPADLVIEHAAPSLDGQPYPLRLALGRHLVDPKLNKLAAQTPLLGLRLVVFIFSGQC